MSSNGESTGDRNAQPAARHLPGDIASLQALLDVLRFHGPQSRGDLVARTGLTRTVLGNRVAELADRGLVESGAVGSSSGGRAPRLLRFRADAGHLLVADIGATGAQVALTDLATNVVAVRTDSFDVAAGPERVLTRTRELFDELRAEAGDGAGDLWGIGIGVPGPVEFAAARVVAPPIMPGWNEFPIREYFADYGVPVWVDNDVNVMALGELRSGSARGAESMIFVKLGTGIGAGLVINGRIHRGVDGCAGDVGHIQVTDDPAVVCRCGNIGCLEAVAGGPAIAAAAERAAADGRSDLLARQVAAQGSLTAADVAWCATHGDQVSVELLTHAARLVGAVVATLVNVVNPAMVVIGGRISGIGDLVLANVREVVYGRSAPLATRALSIQQSSLGRSCGAIGAAAMVADQLFSADTMRQWLDAGRPSVATAGAYA